MQNRSITTLPHGISILKLITIGVSQLGIRLCKVVLVHLKTKRNMNNLKWITIVWSRLMKDMIRDEEKKKTPWVGRSPSACGRKLASCRQGGRRGSPVGGPGIHIWSWSLVTHCSFSIFHKLKSHLEHPSTVQDWNFSAPENMSF